MDDKEDKETTKIPVLFATHYEKTTDNNSFRAIYTFHMHNLNDEEKNKLIDEIIEIVEATAKIMIEFIFNGEVYNKTIN